MAHAPQIVGRYAISTEIAAGGMATVHLGRQLGAVGFSRVVAIKRLHPRMAEDPEFVAMFLDESRIAARIRHPNVVLTSDVVAEGGELFLVMEYVEGESLVRLIKAYVERTGDPPPLRIVAAIVAGVLHGLHAAHDARSERGEPLGVVHRDVSPQNVIVGVDGVARVLDFGIAKAIGRMQTTRVGQVKGKLAYMAPEQIRVQGRVGPAADVWAAAVVLWEALTGRRLFSGDEEAIVGGILGGGAPPPSSFTPALPAEVDAIVLRGLQLDPAARFPSARAMALALEQVVPLASPSEVGAWVATTARDALARRAALVASVEAATPLPAGAAHEETTAVSRTLARGVGGARWRPWLRAALAACAGAALATVGIFLLISPSSPGTRASSTVDPSTLRPSTADPPTADPPTVDPPTVDPPTVDPGTEPSAAPPAVPPSASSSQRAAPSAPRPRPPAARPPSGPDCRVPHYFDAEGIKRYKPGCAR